MSVVDLDELDDVLSGTVQSVQTLFYFDPKSGLMTRMETFGDLSFDPCVIEFDDYREVDGHQLPFQWRISEGDQAFMTLKIQTYQNARASN